MSSPDTNIHSPLRPADHPHQCSFTHSLSTVSFFGCLMSCLLPSAFTEHTNLLTPAKAETFYLFLPPFTHSLPPTLWETAEVLFYCISFTLLIFMPFPRISLLCFAPLDLGSSIVLFHISRIWLLRGRFLYLAFFPRSLSPLVVRIVVSASHVEADSNPFLLHYIYGLLFVATFFSSLPFVLPFESLVFISVLPFS